MRVGIAIGAGVVFVGVTMASIVTGQSSRHASADPPQSPSPAQSQPDTPSSTEPKHPQPPAATERADERARMVEQQIARQRLGGRPIKDQAVLNAMRTVPRHVFVPKARRRQAYDDSPLPIGYGQTISQPYIVAMMSELLELKEDAKVLEIGTGSGYQAAVLAHLTPNVYTLEIIDPLFERAAGVLGSQDYGEVRTRHGDGYFGWAEHAPFDAIIVTCAAGHLPPPLWEQLKPGGRIVIPIGGPYEVQRLIVMTKQLDGSRRSTTVMSVRFVPLTREE